MSERSNKNRSTRLIYTNIDRLFFSICRSLCVVAKNVENVVHVSLSSIDVFVCCVSNSCSKPIDFNWANICACHPICFKI